MEVTNWWDWVGLFGYIGADDKVDVEIFPGKNYEADIWYAGIGLKARKSLTECLKGYIGYGINYTYLKNTYAGQHIETWDDEIGHDFLLGINYYLTENWFLNASARYTLNRMYSDVWHRTSFNPDGLRAWGGIGYKF